MPTAPLLDAAARIVLDATLKGTLLLLAAALATTLLRRSSAAIRHRVWSLTMLGLVLLPALSWLLPQWQLPILPASEPTIETPAPIVAAPAVSRPAPAVDSPAIAPHIELPPPEPVEAWSAATEINADPQPSEVAEFASSPAARTISPWMIVLGAWSLGVILSVGGIAIGIWQARQLSLGSRIVCAEPWKQLLNLLRSRLGLRRAVELRESVQPIVPLTWGLIWPRVLLPQQAQTWAEETRRAVLLHELAHVQRRDVAHQLLGRLACALYWFHPLAWWALRQLRQEREQACDDAVIHSGERASDYAAQLLEVARMYHRPGGLSLAVEMARGSSLEHRIRALFDAARSHSPLTRNWALGMLVLTGMILCAIAIVKPVERVSQAAVEEPAPVKTLADQPWGMSQEGLRCRILAVSPDSFDEEPENALSVDHFADSDDLAFAVELQNVTNRPISLVGIRKANLLRGTANTFNARAIAPNVFDLEVTDANGRPLPQPKMTRTNVTMVFHLANARAEELAPGDSLYVLLRPARFAPPHDAYYSPGEYRLKIRYHGPDDETVRQLDLQRRNVDVVRREIWTGAIVSNEISFRIPDRPAANLVWGAAQGGLQAAVELRSQEKSRQKSDPADTFPVKPQVDTVFHVKNVSDRPVSFISESWRESDVAVAINAAGETQEFKGDSLNRIPEFYRWTLEPSATARLRSWSAGLWALDKPGRYRVNFRINFGRSQIGQYQRPEDFRQELTTGESPITLRERTVDDEPRQEQPPVPTEAAEKVAASLVTLTLTKGTRNSPNSSTQGLGLVVDPRGYVLVPHHLVADVDSIRVSAFEPRQHQGRVVATEPNADVALIKIERTLPAAVFGSSANLKVGDVVFMLNGARQAQPATMTGLDCTVKISDAMHLGHLIQHDIPATPLGISAPLLNAAGEIVGITLAFRSAQRPVGMATPIDDVKPVVARLLQKVLEKEKPKNENGDLQSEGRQGRETRAEQARQQAEEVAIPVSIVIAEHTMLWEGKEIVTWDEIEQRLAAYPEPSRLRPGFFFTRAGQKRERERAAKEALRFKQRFNYYGYRWGSISQRNDARFDRIRTADDLKPDEANKIEGRVLNSDGQPVADAEVVLVTPIPKEIAYQTHALHFNHGCVQTPVDEVITQTDLEGRFQLYPLAGENFALVALHPEAGYVTIRKEQFENDRDLKLKDWAELHCELEGLPNDDEQTISLSCDIAAGDGLPQISFGLEPDAEPKSKPRQFHFTHLPPGIRTPISRSIADKELHMSFLVKEVDVTLSEGESRTLKLGPMSDQQRKVIEENRRDAREREQRQSEKKTEDKKPPEAPKVPGPAVEQNGDLRSEERRGSWLSDLVSRMAIESRGSQSQIRVGVTKAEWGPWQKVDTKGNLVDEVVAPDGYQEVYQTVRPKLVKRYGGSYGIAWSNIGPEHSAILDVVAIDKQGKKHNPRNLVLWDEKQRRVYSIMEWFYPNTLLMDLFDPPIEEIQCFEYRLRPFHQSATLDELLQKADEKTKPALKVESPVKEEGDLRSEERRGRETRAEQDGERAPLGNPRVAVNQGALTYPASVVDKETGKGIAGVKVTIGRWDLAVRPKRLMAETQQTTDDDGNYLIEIPADQAANRSLLLQFDLEHPDYAPRTYLYGLGNILASDSHVEKLPFQRLDFYPVEPAFGTVVAPDGAPVAGVKVQGDYKVPTGTTSRSETVTDDSGKFRLALPHGIDSSIEIIPKDFAMLQKPLEKQRGDLGEIRLSAGMRIRGRVLDVDGRPLAGIPVNFHSRGRERFTRGMLSDADGRFACDPLPAGQYQSSIREYLMDPLKKEQSNLSLPAAFVNERLTLVEGQEPEPLEIKAVPSVRFRAQFVDSSGRKFDGKTTSFMILMIAQQGTEVWGGERRSDENGAVDSRVPRDFQRTVISQFMTPAGTVLRYRLAPGQPLQNETDDIALGPLAEDMPGFEVVVYQAPVVTISAVDDAQQPIEKINVSAAYSWSPFTDLSGKQQPRPRIDSAVRRLSDGRYGTTQMLPDEDVTFTVSAEGYETVSEKVNLPEGATKELVVMLKKSEGAKKEPQPQDQNDQ